MSQEQESLSDKIHDLADTLNDKLEPDETGPRPPQNDATDPFSDDQRPDETGQEHGSVAGAEHHTH